LDYETGKRFEENEETIILILKVLKENKLKGTEKWFEEEKNG